MSSVRLSLGALGATVLMLGAAAAQGIELPAGPNREVVSRECQACHDLSMVVAATGLTRDGWIGVIDGDDQLWTERHSGPADDNSRIPLDLSRIGVHIQQGIAVIG